MPKPFMDAKDIQKENFKLAIGVFLRTILSAVLCLFVYLSMTVMITGMSTKTIGYRVFEIDSSGGTSIIEEHYYANESSLPSSDGEESSAPTRPTNQTEQPIRSEVPKGASVAMDIISSVFMLLLLAAFPYSVLWSKGDRDKNSVNFGHMAEDKLRGLKVGAIAAIPSFIGYMLLVLSKAGMMPPEYMTWFRFMNVPFWPIINGLSGQVAVSTADVSAWAILALLVTVLFVPAVCHFAYTLGYKQISLTERFIYVNPSKKRRRHR